MKKLLTLTILLSATALVAKAEDTVDLLEVLEVNNAIKEQKEVVDTVNQYVSQRLFQLELKPKFMASRLAYRNTFMWYIWNDFDEATGFNKLELGEQIHKLTK